MTPFDIAAVLISLAALFGVLNHHVLRLPPTIGIVIIALLSALGVMAVDALFPGLGISGTVRALVLEIDFSEALLEGMLGFLLFAGALHVDLESLRRRGFMVGLTASLGVVISTVIIGTGFHYATGAPFWVSLVFGALVTPTDPVAVLGILKQVKVPESLEAKIAGESLFNDGVAVVVVLVLVAIAFPEPGAVTAAGAAADAAGTTAAADAAGHTAGAADIAMLFLQEAVGGAVLGGIAGFAVFQVMRRIDDYVLEVLLTLALVMGTYALAHGLHMSGPIAVVVAGLFIGHTGVKHGMSEATRRQVDSFWRLIDEILNAALFLLIGLEVFAVTLQWSYIGAGLLAIPLALGARFVAVGVPLGILNIWRDFTKGALPVMVWGGLRGGISVALALSLPESEWKPLILTATYVVVLFSIIVQGLTVEAVVQRFVRD